jgi:uncharacterized membrane protein
MCCIIREYQSGKNSWTLWISVCFFCPCRCVLLCGIINATNTHFRLRYFLNTLATFHSYHTLMLSISLIVHYLIPYSLTYSKNYHSHLHSASSISSSGVCNAENNHLHNGTSFIFLYSLLFVRYIMRVAKQDEIKWKDLPERSVGKK